MDNQIRKFITEQRIMKLGQKLVLLKFFGEKNSNFHIASKQVEHYSNLKF